MNTINSSLIDNATSAHNTVDLVIIGAGQAGLALSARMKELRPDISMLILDRCTRVGDNWRSRYDSLQLFTPRKYSQLPNLAMAGDPEGFPLRDEVADYLEQYVAHFKLPIAHDIEVTQVQFAHLTDDSDNNLSSSSQANMNRTMSSPACSGTFHLTIKGEEKPICCKRLVLAHGPFRTPNIPVWSRSIDPQITQLHTSAYMRPDRLPEGDVLVVGAGNSGVQIAVELSRSHRVSLSVRSPIRHVPLRLLGKSTFEWMDILGFLHAPSNSRRARIMRQQGDPVFGYELKEALRTNRIQLLAAAAGWNPSSSSVAFADRSSMSPTSIVWATGFKQDNRWLQLPNLLNPEGELIYTGHHTPIPELFVIGMPWQQARSSALICGAGRDAEVLASELAQHHFH